MEHSIIYGDCLTMLSRMPSDLVDCCVTAVPFWRLLEVKTHGCYVPPTSQEFLTHITAVFNEVKRVLKPTGTLWLSIGDSYADPGRAMGGDERFGKAHTSAKREPGLKSGDLVGIPWRTALALRDAGWFLRQEIIWSKPNPMPESIRCRCAKAHEHIFLMTKTLQYYFNAEAIQEDGITPGTKRWKRDVWTIKLERHYDPKVVISFPKPLITPCVLAGCPPGGTVLDPFAGAGTVMIAAHEQGKNSVSIDINPACVSLMQHRKAHLPATVIVRTPV